MAVPQPATAASRGGKTGEYGSRFGLPFLASWTNKVSWTGARLSRRAALYRLERGEDITYGWKGKGSTIHLLTDGNGLPLAFLVIAANVAEVTVGLLGLNLRSITMIYDNYHIICSDNGSMSHRWYHQGAS
jgi:hypothetical protein